MMIASLHTSPRARAATGLVTDHPARVALRTLRPLVGHLRHQGHDVAGLLTRTGIDPLSLFEPSAYIPFPLMLDMWRHAEALCEDPQLGLHVLERIDVRLFEQIQQESEWVLIQLFVLSPTVGEGLARFARYFPVGFYGSGIDIERHEGTVRVRHRVYGVRDVPRGFSEFIIGLLARMLDALPSRPVRPLGMRFAHAAPPSLEVHERLLRAPVCFHAGEDALLLEEVDLDVPLRAPNPRLVLGLEGHADELLSRMPPLDSFVEQVRALISSELPEGNPNADHIADMLQMSARTLSRRLGEFGTSHKALLDEVRAGLARRYLVEERRAVNEVATLLGFSEVSAFHRAFRRWYGKSPTGFRHEAHAEGG